jgi:hypothetical protein
MQKHLEHYLDTVNKGLELVPASEREKEIAELRQHLDALAQAHWELGESEENAAVHATQQFGPATTVYRRLVAAYWRRRLSAFRQSWIGAIVCTILAVYSVYAYVPIVVQWLISYNPSYDTTFSTWYSYTLLFLACCFAGWLPSRLSGRRSLPVLAAIVIWFNLHYIFPQIVRGPRSYEDWRLLIVIASGSLVLPLMTAYLSLHQSKSFRNV